MLVFNAVTIVWCVTVVASLGFAGFLITKYNV
jgi:hypothetical protein